MTKITPYTALCELFRNKVDPNNDLENRITGTEQHGNEILLQNHQKNVPTTNNSCQTHPLRDYSVDTVMQKLQKTQMQSTDKHAVNIALTDDNFQILRPDYAAYSGEKPYVEVPPVKQEFNLRKIADKIQEGPKESSFTPLFNRPWMKNKNTTQSTINPQKVNNQTSMTRPNGAFQERIVEPSNNNQHTCKNRDLEVFPELNLYRRIPATKQDIHDYTQDLEQDASEVSPTRKPNPVQIHSSYKNPKVNALYRTVSNLKTTFENKYHHCPNDNAEKCLCDHCGALAVVNESLKHPVIYDHHQEDDDESIYCKKHRKTVKRNNKHDEKEFLKLTTKLRMMEDRIQELEEMNYIQGPIKIRNSALTFDMYTQCGKKKKKTRFTEPPECYRSPSPHKRFNPKVCPFSFTLPLNLKDRLFRRKSQDRKSENDDSDDSDYKVKHISRIPQRENIPKTRLRCHDYINKKKDVGTPPKKPSFWRSGKIYNVAVQNDEIPTKDIDVKAIKDKQIQELLLELSQRKNALPTPEPKSVRFALDLKTNDTEVLYERKENDRILSSKSLLNKDSIQPTKTYNSSLLQPKIPSNETTRNNSDKDYNYFFLKSPKMIEQLVQLQSYPASTKSYSSALLEHEIPSNEATKNSSGCNYFLLKSSEMENLYPASTEIPSKLNSVKQEQKKLQSSKTPSHVSTRNSMSRKQDEIFQILHSIKQKQDFFNTYSSKVNITPISKPASKQTKSSTEISALSQISDSTTSKSVCRYINTNYTNETSTTVDLNSSCDTVRNYKRSRSFSPGNKNSFDIETKQSLKSVTKRKKLTITIPHDKDKRPKSERNSRHYQDKYDTTHKHFIKMNKNVDRSKYDFSPRSRTPEDMSHLNAQIVNYNINDCIAKEIDYFEEIIKQETEINDAIKKDPPSPRKKWNFSILNLTSEDMKINYEESKVKKQQIIKELSRLSDSNSNFSTQISIETSTESNRINNNDTTPVNTPENDSNSSSKETMKNKSSIFSLLIRYSKQFLPKRKSKIKPSVKVTLPLLPPSKTNLKSAEEPKTQKIVNNKNISKIPVYKQRNSSSASQDAKTSGIFKFFTGKMCDKFCLFKPEMIDKETKLSNETIPLDVVPSYTITNADKYEEVNNKLDANENRDESPVNTLVLNSIDSIFQTRSSSKTMSNIIIFNPANYNRNLPIICEQTPNNAQRNNLSIQTIVLQNLMPSIRENDRQVILFPAKDTDTNPHCSTCNNTSLNLNPPESKVSNSTVNKSASNTSKSSKTEKKKDMIAGKCSSTLKCKTSEKKIKEVNYLPLEEKAVPIQNKSTKEYIQEDKCSCKSEKSSKCSTGICKKDKQKCSKMPCQKGTKQNVKIKKDVKFEAPTSDLKSSCSCKTSPTNLPKSLGVRSNLRKNKFTKPGKCVKCTKGNAPVIKPDQDVKTNHPPQENCKSSSHTIGTPAKVKDQLNKKGCSCVSITQEDLLGPGEIAKTNKKPKKREGSKCGSKCGSRKTATPAKDSEIIKPILNQKECKQDSKHRTTVGTPAKVTEVQLDKNKCSCASIKQDILLGPGEIAKNKNKPKKNESSKCSLKCSSHTIKTPKVQSVEKLVQGDTNKGPCKCAPSTQNILLGPGEIPKKQSKSTKIPGNKCNLKCSSHTIKTAKVQSVEKLVQGDTNKGPCKCAQSTQDILLGPGEIPKKNKPAKTGESKCSLKCSSHTIKTPKVQSVEKLISDDTNKGPCKCVPSTKDILLGPGETPKKQSKPTKIPGNKCNLKCSSQTAKTSKVQSVEKLVPGDTNKGSCKCAPSTQNILLGPEEIPKKQSKPTKIPGNKCNLKCSSQTAKTTKKQSVEKLVQGDTNKGPCKCAKSTQEILLGPGEIPKKQNKPTKIVGNKCNLKCSSHTVNTTKKQSVEKIVQGDTNKGSCKCGLSTKNILLESGKYAQQNKKPVKSVNSKCNLKCNKETVSVSKEPSVQSSTSRCSCKSQKASGYNIEKEETCKKAKCFTTCVRNKQVLKQNVDGDSSTCDCKLPKDPKLIPEQSEACKKIKCKRCAPPPPVQPKIKRTESNCTCDLSNVSISFETDQPKPKPKQKPSVPKNTEVPPQCQCPGPNSGKCVKCTVSKPIIDSSIPKKTVLQNKSSKCVCKPASPFPERAGKKKPSKTGVGKCNPDRCSKQDQGDKLSLEILKEPVPSVPTRKPKDVTKKKDISKKVHIQKKVKKVSSKSSQTSLKPSHSNLPSKTNLKKSPSKHSTLEDPKKKKSKTKVKSKSPSLSKKSSRISSCSVCTECKRKISEQSLQHKNIETVPTKKKICNFRKMKNKITSKFSCKYFKSLYKHPIFARASRSKCKEMRMCIKNFCDVSKKDFDRVDAESSEAKENNLLYGNTNSSVVNIYYNMQRFCFEPASDEVSYTDEDWHLTEDDKRDYLLEKLYLIRNFRDRIQDEESTSNYRSFE